MPTALVTGASTGIGLEIVRALARRGYRTFLTARSEAKSAAAAAPLRGEGLPVEPLALEVTDPRSVEAAAREAERRMKALDALVSNAAVLLDEAVEADDLDPEVLATTLAVNTVAPLRVVRAFLPLLRRSRAGRIVFVSSTAGSLADLADRADGDFTAPAYCASKAALNSLAISLSHALRADRILVNACCPGWVRTAMGGPHAPLAPAEGADTPVWLATLPDDGPTGGFFLERAPTPW
jgi:NAD(P)-dependent dehydrogenase (short-subunit alcohol dehydrogenase family)